MSNVNVVKERLEWIDCMRALAMYLVILCHLIGGLSDNVTSIVSVIIAPIMVPLFFSITGWVFNEKNKSQCVFYKNLFIKIIIPWLLMTLIIPRAVYIPIKGWTYWFNMVKDVISGKSSWFISALIVAQIITFYIRKISKDNTMFAALSLLCVIIGGVMAYYDVFNYAMINRGFIAQGFFMIGFFLKRLFEKVKDISWIYIIMGILIYLGLCAISLIMYPGECMDIHLNLYQNIPLCILQVIIGNFVIYSVARKINYCPKLIVYMGQNTIITYVYNALTISALNFIFTRIGLSLGTGLMISVLKAAVVMLICSFEAWIINTFFPELLGKKRKHHFLKQNQKNIN